MQRLPVALLLLLLLCGLPGFAGETPAEVEPAPATTLKMGYEFEGMYSYVGSAKTDFAHNRTGNVSEQNGIVRLLLTPQWGQGPIFRVGLGLQRYSFSLPSNAPIPNTLQSVSVILGVDFQLGDSWLMRAEVEPGFYAGSDDVDSGDFNAPFIIGGSYVASAAVQYVFGLSVDINRRYPIIPAIGVRWNISGPWTINAVLPTPRLEYAYSKSVTIYTGAEIKDGTYRMGADFGSTHGDTKLNQAYVEYEEIRVGAGLTWKVAPSISFEAEAGYLPYREFNFHRAEVGSKTRDGAPYGQVGLSAKF